MFDTPAKFLSFINANGGNSQVMMFIFNNSYTKVFADNDVFDPATMFDSATGIFKFVEEDVKARKYHSFKHLMYIEGVVMAPPGENKDKIYYRNFRP